MFIFEVNHFCGTKKNATWTSLEKKQLAFEVSQKGQKKSNKSRPCFIDLFSNETEKEKTLSFLIAIRN